MGLFKSDPPPPPNYSPLIASATANQAQYNKLMQQQLDWAKQTYADNKAVTDQVVSRYLQQQDENMANARKDRARYEGLYQPLEDQAIYDAQHYADADNMERMRGRATGYVARNFEAQRQNTMRDLESYGINPGALRYAALDTTVRTQQAAAEAAAANQSDLQTEATARALRGQMIDVGRGYPGQTVGEYGAGAQGGAGAGNTTLSQTQTGSATMMAPTAYGQLGNQAITSAGNLMHQGYGDQMAAWNAENADTSGLAMAAGLAAGTAMRGGFPGLPSGMPQMPGTGPYPFAASGGAIPDAPPAPGAVPRSALPAGAPAVDGVPARLTPGEFVVPRDVASWMGEERLQKMIMKAREDKKGGAVAKPKMKQALPMAPTFHGPSRQALPTG